MIVNFHHLVKNQFHGFQPESEIHNRRHGRSHRAHEVGVGEHSVAQRRLVAAVFYACRLNNVANFHVVGACHLTAFAV